MGLELKNVVPWGRTRAEYQAMFQWTPLRRCCAYGSHNLPPPSVRTVTKVSPPAWITPSRVPNPGGVRACSDRGYQAG